MKERIKREFTEFVLLMHSVPPMFAAVFIVALVAMNLLANKSINTGLDWLALDCGIVVSWIAFLVMDVMAKHFGAKASTELSIVAVIVNLVCCLIFFAASKIDGVWGESYVEGSETVINGALDNTFGGTWYVLLGSTVAFVASAIVNNCLNFAIGKAFKRKPDGFAAYACRSYVSTAVAQFTDNLVFAFLVSKIFFGWSAVACVVCAATGMVVELLCEVAFSHVGFLICKRWKARGVGAEYFAFRSGALANGAVDNETAEAISE